MPRKLSALIQMSLTVVLAQSGAAQTQAPEQNGIIKITSREVVVDVVVRDRHGQMVRDLIARDFGVYEDGVQQRITSFRNIQGQEQTAADGKAKPGNSQATVVASPTSAREMHLVTIVVGEIAATHLAFARNALEQFLKSEVAPDTYMTVLRLDHRLSIVQAFTNDKEALFEAAKRATTLHASNFVSAEATANAESAFTMALNQPTGPGASPNVQPSFNPTDVMTQRVGPPNAAQQTEAALADSLRFMNDYVSGMNTMDMLRELVRSQSRLQARRVVLFLADGLSIPAERPDVFAGVISDANRAGVTFYTFDTKALNIDDNPLLTPATQGVAQLNKAVAEGQMAAGLGQGSIQGPTKFDVMHAADDITLLGSANPDLSMRELAERTGGFATISTNNIVDPMRRVAEDIGTHYELTYTPTGANDGKFRNINVKVDRPKVVIEARRGYFALPEINGEPIQPFELAALNAINERPLPHAVPFSADLLKFRPNQAGTQCAVMLQVPIASLTPARDPKTGAYHVRIAFMALLQDANGEVLRRISREMDRDVPANQWTTAQRESISYSQPMTLMPGRYTLSAAVIDNSIPAVDPTRIGSKRMVEMITAPGALSLSSVQLVQRVQPMDRPADPNNPFELEGKRLTFTLSDKVPKGTAAPLYFVIYPAQKTDTALQLFLQLFENGKEVARTSPPVPKPDDTGAIPIYAEVTPPPGSYDVHVIVKQGELTAQETRSLVIQ